MKRQLQTDQSLIEDYREWQVVSDADANTLVVLGLIHACTGSCPAKTYHLTAGATWATIDRLLKGES